MNTTQARWFGLPRTLVLLCAAALAAGASAQQPEPVAASAAPAASANAATLRDIQGLVPRPVRAAGALLGMGRQRLALVVGLGTVGGQRVLDSALRDTQAVAGALRSSGFVVMQRNDVVAADLRASLQEFHDRLQPGGVGFVYVTGLAAQLDGQNLLLPRDTTLATGTSAAQLRATGVPLADVLAALAGTPDSPRLLVVDAAYRHPALAAVAAPGLAEARLPPGTMALFSHAPGSLHDATAAVPLPTPAPADARDIAATAFARTLVDALLTPRTNGPDALRNTRRAVVDATQGQDNPWLGGDTDSREELAEADLLDSMVPRTPEELARETARQGARLLTKPAGEQSVAQILQQSAAASSSPGQATAIASNGGSAAAQGSAADNTSSSSSAGSTLGSAVSAIGTVAAVASAAATVASIGAGIKRAETDAATSLATSAAQTGVSLAGSAAAALLQAAAGQKPNAAPAAPAASPVVATAATGAVTTGGAAPPSALPAAPATATTSAPPAAAAPPTAAAAAQPSSPSSQRLARAVAASAARAAADDRTTRAEGRGERPAYVPRSNAFGYAEGDTFTYRIIDNWTERAVSDYTTSIDAVLADGQLLANGSQLQMDPQGRIQRQAHEDGSVSEFQPYQDLWWSNPQRGQRHAVEFAETFERADHVRGSTAWSGSASVGRARQLELPAGSFEVLPIESGGWFTETLANGTRSSGKWSRTVWYSTQLGHPVAIDIEDTDRLGALVRRERIELLHAQSSRLPPP